MNSERSDQFLASKFKGTDVIGSDEQKIGDVSDILFDKDGKIEAYVMGIGGFLGIGVNHRSRFPGIRAWTGAFYFMRSWGMDGFC